jgi:DNA invertase Pin-like site-specific DNA recombinase
MEKYIYIRVSSKDQNEARQLADAENLEIPQNNIYVDKQSGKDFNRPAYQELINKLQEGDVVYLHSIDRLGRNYEGIIEEWNRITKTIKADIVVLDMPLLDTTMKNADLTGRFVADLVLQILSYVAQKERDSIKQRQKEGIALAKDRGAYRHMTASDEEFFEIKKLVDNGEISVSAACERLGLKSRKSWYNRLEIYKRDGKL